MKKNVFLLLLIAILTIFLVACSAPAEDEDTAVDTVAKTEAPTETEAPVTEAPVETEAPETDDVISDEPNMLPYNGDVIPGSVDFGWGAPDTESVFFPIDDDHVIHDGKGTWSNDKGALPSNVFDGDFDTFYDCDEKCETVNDDAMNMGIVLENWNDDLTKTGYVGAWIEEGVVISQIRYFTRSGWVNRVIGGTFQASVDGETWVDLHTITEVLYGGVDYEFIDIEDDTVYYYVRFLSRDLAKFNELVDPESIEYEGYTNISEMEIWGTPGK